MRKATAVAATRRALPATSAVYVVRPVRCPRCDGRLIDEPGASRCFMCGQIFYLAAALRLQREFELLSGVANVGTLVCVRRTAAQARNTHATAE